MFTKTARNKEAETDGDITHVGGADITLAPSLDSDVTFEDLRAFASARVTEGARLEAKSEDQTKQALAQTMSALNRAKNHATGSVRASLAAELKRAEKEARLKGNRNPKRRAAILVDLLDELEDQRRNDASSTTTAVLTDDQAGDQRSPFGESIVIGRQRNGLTQSELTTLLGVSSASMSRWEHNTIPLETKETHKIINKMERVLGYGKDFQWNMIAGKGRLYSYWPAEIPDDGWLRRLISERVGNLRGLSEAEQCAKRLAAYRELQAEDKERVYFEPYSLTMDFAKWPERFRDDWIMVLKSHMAFEKLPDDEQHLVERPAPIDRPFMKDRITGNTLYPSGKPLKQASAEHYSMGISCIFGSCVNAIRTRELKRRVTASPFAIIDREMNDDQLQVLPLFDRKYLESMGLTLALCPKVLEHFFRVQITMKELSLTKKELREKKVTKINRVQARYAGTMTKIVRWIEQQPYLAQRLKPIPGVLTDEQVAEAQKDWSAFCNAAVIRYERIYEGTKTRTAESYDHSVALDGLLLDQPQGALIAIFDNHVDELAKYPERDIRRAEQIEAALATGTAANCYYRPGTNRRLNFNADNTGHLRHHIEDECKVWRMHVTKDDVKNHNSPAMMHGDSRLLTDLSGNYYACIGEYVEWARDLLLAGRVTNALFVRTSGIARHTGDSYGAYVRRLNARAMKEDNPEFHGATVMNSIQTRKAGGTDAYNEEKGSLVAAGKALGNMPHAALVYVKVWDKTISAESSARVKKKDEDRRAARAKLK